MLLAYEAVYSDIYNVTPAQWTGPVRTYFFPVLSGKVLFKFVFPLILCFSIILDQTLNMYSVCYFEFFGIYCTMVFIDCFIGIVIEQKK